MDGRMMLERLLSIDPEKARELMAAINKSK
jgi:hypothetical protein